MVRLAVEVLVRMLALKVVRVLVLVKGNNVLSSVRQLGFVVGCVGVDM